MKLTETQIEQVKSYIAQVNKLKGRPSRNKPLEAGRQQLYVKSYSDGKSKSGKPMLTLELINYDTGYSNKLYVLHTDKTFEKLQFVKEGYLIDGIIKGVGGFVKCQMIKLIDTDVEAPEEPMMNVTNLISYDVEVFKHDWSVVFEDVLTGLQFKITNSLNKLQRFLQKHQDNIFIGFNNNGYDKHIIKGLIDNKNVYAISKQIIDGEDPLKVYQMYNKDILNLAEIDLYQDRAGFSLKEHNGFNGLEIKETDIDFDIDRNLTEEELTQNIYYNGKDVEGTTVRFMNLIGDLQTKAMLCELYDLDYTWLFKTNANVVAKILKAKFHQDRGDTYNKYEKPDWITFNNPDILRQVNEWILDREVIPTKHKTKNGEKILTTDLKYSLTLRDLIVELGSGGLHGAIKGYIKKKCVIKQADVGSLYPNTLVLHGYLSRNIPKQHVHLYSDILRTRMEYKHQGEKTKEQALKLVLNTMYGVLRANFNDLFDPRQAILINITGQLAMLDLADKIEPYATISAMNTDSINYEAFNDECDAKIEEIKKEWCERSGYELDTDIITDIAQANVNNYICRFDNGKLKTKGAVSMGGGVKWSKAVVYNAVKEYFMNETPVEETIKECTDLRDFQIITKTGWTYDKTFLELENGEYEETQKVNRVFAVKHELGLNEIKIRKWKKGEHLENPNTKEDVSEKEIEAYEEYVRLIGEWTKEFGYESSLEHWENTRGSYSKGLQNEPEHYVLSNEAIEDSKISLNDLDLQYYIDEANRMIDIYNEGSEIEEESEEE